MNGYELSRVWFAYTYNHPDKFSPIDTALYFWIIEVFNRARWSEKIYLPSGQAMQHIGCKSYKAYINSFNKLEAEGFIKVVERSKNQYTANIIALVSNTKALTEASTKATTNASTEALTNASTVYKNIEHTTENKEKAHPIFEKPNLQRQWDIPFMPDFVEKILKHPNGKSALTEISELWDTWIAVRYKAHNKQFTSDISEAQALKTLIAKCKGSTQVIESIKRMIIVESVNPFAVEIEKAKDEKETITHFGIAANRLG
jgi:hypothetical protein